MSINSKSKRYKIPYAVNIRHKRIARVKIYNGDCLKHMYGLHRNGIKANVILTSPPYNTSRVGGGQKAIDNHEQRYDVHLDNKTNEDYIDWTRKIFRKFDTILAENGCILYNLSYGAENVDLLWLTIASIIESTPFTIADCIVWKKSHAIPNNMSPNRLTRIIEFVFVICRKTEAKTFQCNKEVVSICKSGQKNFKSVVNFIKAKNNDGMNSLNKATFSSDLVLELLRIYSKRSDIIYDPFMGTGTTAVGVVKYNLEHGGANLKCLGSEISEKQCLYAKDRLYKIIG